MEWQAGGAPPVPVVDWPELLMRVGGDKRLVAELVDLFAQDCPDRLDAIRQAVEGLDPVALERPAHQFTGALVLFGAPAAVEAARRLEGMGRCAELGRAAEWFTTLQGETQRLLKELSELT